jgi:hypothetical protein
MTDKISQITNSEEFKKYLPAIIAGTAGAGAGAFMTGGRDKEKNESRVGHLGRVLRNALISGGLAAGGTAAISKGLENTFGSMDPKNPITGSEGNEGPLSSNIKGLLFSPGTAAASGATALGLTSGLKGIGSGEADKALQRQDLLGKLGVNEAEMARAARSPKAIQDLIDAQTHNKVFQGAPFKLGIDAAKAKELQAIRRAAGLAAGETELARALSYIGRKGLATFGATPERNLVRGGLALTAAAIPAIIGATVTDDTHK